MMTKLKVTLRTTPSRDQGDPRFVNFYEHKKFIDAVSIEADFDGYTHANATLIQYGIDQQHFKRAEGAYKASINAIISPELDPMIITSPPIEKWTDFFKIAIEIITCADCECANTLCISQFGRLSDDFPIDGFVHFIAYLQTNPPLDYLNFIVFDFDSKHFITAHQVLANTSLYYCTPESAKMIDTKISQSELDE